MVIIKQGRDSGQWTVDSRQEAGGSRQEAVGSRQEAGGYLPKLWGQAPGLDKRTASPIMVITMPTYNSNLPTRNAEAESSYKLTRT